MPQPFFLTPFILHHTKEAQNTFTFIPYFTKLSGHRADFRKFKRRERDCTKVCQVSRCAKRSVLCQGQPGVYPRSSNCASYGYSCQSYFQTGEEVTEIEFLELFGNPVQTTNMKELKKKG